MTIILRFPSASNLEQVEVSRDSTEQTRYSLKGDQAAESKRSRVRLVNLYPF